MRIGSLFSGYGGLDLAAQQYFGGNVAWYSEIEPAACQILTAHHPIVPNLGDITIVDWATVEPIDVLTGGYPCQPFSHAGKRKGSSDERHLWPFVATAINALRPRVVVLENVRGHLSLGFGDVLSDLSRMGYNASWGVVRASDAGAPHGRARIFIVAYPNGSGRNQDVKQPGDICAAANEGQSGDSDGHCADGSAPDGVSAPDADGDGHGQQQDTGRVGSVDGGNAGPSRQRQRSRSIPDAGGDESPTDTDGAAGSERDERETARRRVQHRDDVAGSRVRRDAVDWGKYGAAIARWERILGRAAPDPTIVGANGRPRLSPLFVEWMMGLDLGHVTGHGLRPAQELKALGNGVCPQQAHLALRMILGRAS